MSRPPKSTSRPPVIRTLYSARGRYELTERLFGRGDVTVYRIGSNPMLVACLYTGEGGYTPPKAALLYTSPKADGKPVGYIDRPVAFTAGGDAVLVNLELPLITPMSGNLSAIGIYRHPVRLALATPGLQSTLQVEDASPLFYPKPTLGAKPRVVGYMWRTVYTSDGDWVAIGPRVDKDAPEGVTVDPTGGEGTVYTVYRPARKQTKRWFGNTYPVVFKKYHKATPLAVARLEAIVKARAEAEELCDHQLCLPVAMAYDRDPHDGGRVVGCLTKRAPGLSLDALLRESRGAATQWTRLDLVVIATSVLRLMEKLHKYDMLVGDICPRNIFVTKDLKAYLIDLDGCQMEGYACTSSTDGYVSARLNRQRLDHPDDLNRAWLRDPADEYYAISVLLFQMFMWGKRIYRYADDYFKRYNGEGHDDGRRIFLYPKGYSFTRYADNETVDLQAMSMWFDLPAEMREAFYSVFEEGREITPPQWRALLGRYMESLRCNQLTNIIYTPVRKRTTRLPLVTLPANTEPVTGPLSVSLSRAEHNELLTVVEMGDDGFRINTYNGLDKASQRYDTPPIVTGHLGLVNDDGYMTPNFGRWFAHGNPAKGQPSVVDWLNSRAANVKFKDTPSICAIGTPLLRDLANREDVVAEMSRITSETATLMGRLNFGVIPESDENRLVAQYIHQGRINGPKCMHILYLGATHARLIVCMRPKWNKFTVAPYRFDHIGSRLLRNRFVFTTSRHLSVRHAFDHHDLSLADLLTQFDGDIPPADDATLHVIGLKPPHATSPSHDVTAFTRTIDTTRAQIETSRFIGESLDNVRQKGRYGLLDYSLTAPFAVQLAAKIGDTTITCHTPDYSDIVIPYLHEHLVKPNLKNN